MNSISLIVIGLFKLSTLFGVNCGSLCFLRKWSFSPKLSNFCVQSCSQHSFTILSMSAGSVVMPRFVPVIAKLCLLSFFLCHSYQRYAHFIDLLKKKTSSLFHWFSLFFSVFNLIQLCSLLFPSFCLFWVYFALLFSRFLRQKLRSLIWNFSSFLMCVFSAIDFLLSSAFTVTHNF